ncbi:MAG: hypothetical protein IJV15_05615 [Lachnospiraceae bacterium]|nr:hypothetical protein [Lachnospiraceae bacterium]
MKKWLFDKIKLIFIGVLVTFGLVAFIFSTELEWLWLAALGDFIVSFAAVWIGVSLSKVQYPDFFESSSDDKIKQKESSRSNVKMIATFIFVFIVIYLSMLGAYFASINR